jgi:hypothetical protein
VSSAAAWAQPFQWFQCWNSFWGCIPDIYIYSIFICTSNYRCIYIYMYTSMIYTCTSVI